MSRILNTNVAVPKDSGKLRLKTYGILDIGDVPISAFVIKATPNEFMMTPAKKPNIPVNIRTMH